MDAGHKSNRLYPGYTTQELKAFVAVEADATIKAKMEGEIAAREAGLSKPLIVPQIKGGRIVPRIGRM